MPTASAQALPGLDLDEGLLCLDSLLVDGRSLDSAERSGVMGLEAWLEELVIGVQCRERNLAPVLVDPIPRCDTSAREPFCLKDLLNLVEKASPGGRVLTWSQLAVNVEWAVEFASPDILHVGDGAASGGVLQHEEPLFGEC